MRSPTDLHDYQHKAVAFIKEKKRCLLALAMGLGKSVIALTAIRDLSDGFAINKTLVIAPLRVAINIWSQEAQEWSHLKQLKISLIIGTERQRLAAMLVDADVYVINRENTEWLVKSTRKWGYDCVVIDESDSFKNVSSRRFKAIRRVLPDTRYMILLSGTPAPNGLLDLWAQIYLIDFGERLCRTITAYKQRFFEADYFGYKFTLRKGAADQIHNLLDDKVLSMRAEDYLELPERIYINYFVDLPQKSLDSYKDFEATLLATLPAGEEIEAVNAAVLAGKLLQWANGATYVDTLHNWAELHSAKLDALGEIIDDNPGENILVAYNYQHDLARLQDRFPQGVVMGKDPQTIVDWNDGKIPLLFAHPASAGHGLNLQGGGCVSVWFGLCWSLGQYQQFNARLHRQGQGRPVRIIHIVANDTIDDRVLDVLSDKDAVQSNLLRALRHRS